ncbi:hypothetical protein FIU89_15390 [Roseovarius sp. THAF27]|nr:hypothetical protein FIU89_15390 [Roseovarius sp. THAF27]
MRVQTANRSRIQEPQAVALEREEWPKEQNRRGNPAPFFEGCPMQRRKACCHIDATLKRFPNRPEPPDDVIRRGYGQWQQYGERHPAGPDFQTIKLGDNIREGAAIKKICQSVQSAITEGGHPKVPAVLQHPSWPSPTTQYECQGAGKERRDQQPCRQFSRDMNDLRPLHNPTIRKDQLDKECPGREGEDKPQGIG